MILHSSARIVAIDRNVESAVGSALKAPSDGIHPSVIAVPGLDPGIDPAIHLYAKKDGAAGQARG
jgi:hypothetical protein